MKIVREKEHPNIVGRRSMLPAPKTTLSSRTVTHVTPKSRISAPSSLIRAPRTKITASVWEIPPVTPKSVTLAQLIPPVTPKVVTSTPKLQSHTTNPPDFNFPMSPLAVSTPTATQISSTPADALVSTLTPPKTPVPPKLIHPSHLHDRVMVIDRKNSLEMKAADSKRAFVKKRSKVTASEVRKHVISGLLPIHRLQDGENGFDLDISMMGKVQFTEPVPPIDVETLLEQRKTCLLYSISSPKSSKPIFEYVSDDVEVKTIRQDGLSDHNYTTIPNIENHVRDICAFYCDDFSLVNRKHAQLGTEDIKDRWNLEKLTALRSLRPQLFHSGLRIMDREPSTISLDGTSYDTTDLSKCATEQFYVSMLKKSAIDRNTLLYSMLSKNRVKHFLNCINSEEREWKWEKRGIPRLPEQEETPKLFVKVEKAIADPYFEPLFVSMAVYDIRNRQKVTESVYFNIADHDKLDMLGKHQPNFLNNNMQSLFNITGVLSDMFLVIKIEKVLQQTDVFDNSEPYTGTKEERNLEKLKATAEDNCQRLGAYRTLLGFQVVDIQRVFNANVSATVCGDRKTDPMMASQCTTNSGVVITTAGQNQEDRCSITSADRTSISSMSSTLRRFGSGTSAATVFSRVRTPLTKRKFAPVSNMTTSRDVPDCLDNMPSCNLKFSTFIRQEGDKTSEDDIYRLCSEVRKAHGKINKKMFNFELELTLAGSNKSKECQSHGSNLTLSSENMIHEAMEIPKYKSTLNKSYKNVIFVYPKHINLSNRTGNARNIMIKVELMDASEVPQDAVFEKGANRQSLLKSAKTTVIYHNRTPHFTDEIKLSLPCDLNDGHHLLFTVYHISCKDGDSSSAENPIGYTWLPLYRNGKLRSGDFHLPVCGEKPPSSYGYLDAHNALPNLKWIDNHKPIFFCSTKMISSVHAQDDYLEKFLTGVASLSSNDIKKPPVGESELIHCIDNLLKAGPDKLVAFIHFILSRLLFLIANPPYTDELSMKCFECIGNLVKLFSRMLDSDIDAHNRSMLLSSYIKYRKLATQESKPHSNIRPVELKSSPTDNSMITSMIEHVERTHSSTNLGATNVRLHESLLEVWLRARGTARENSLVNSWFLLEIILKASSEYLTMTGRMFSSRKIRFGDQFLKNVETLIEILAQEVITRHANDFEEAKMISNSLGYFLRDCFSIMDRTFVMKLVHKYLTAFSESMKKLAHNNELLSIKIEFIRVVCSYEHYLIVNVLSDIDPPESTVTGAAPPVSSLTGSKGKRNTLVSWTMNDSSRSTHYLSGQVMSDVKDAIASGNTTLCAKAIETVKELLQSHELDNRISEGESAAQVANIYKPLVGIVLDNIDCLYSGSIRNSTDVSSTNSFVEQTLRQDVMAAIAGKLRNSPDPSFGKLQMDLSMTKSILCCMFWVLKHIDREDLQHWIGSLDHEYMLKLLHILYYTMSTFEIKDDPVTARRSPDKTSLSKLDEEPEPGEVKWRTRSSDTCDSRADRVSTQEAVASDAIVSCEVFMCVVELIDNIITVATDVKNSQFHILPMVFPIIMHGLSCNASDQVLEVIFAAQQNFFAKFPDMILEQKPELCAELSQQILRHCSSTKLENVRTMATVSLYHFLRENYKLYKNLTRARTFLSTALSTLLSGSCGVDIFVNDEFMTKSLEIANQLAAEDDTFDDSTKKKLTEQMNELTANLQKIMLSTVRMREHVNDYEMTIDLMYQLVEGYSNNPDLRITWLLNMAERHEKQRNLCEAAHSYLQACALVFEYIAQRDQNLAFESKGAATFAEITPNAIKESRTNFNSVKNADNENHIQSYHFTEAGLVKILEKSFSLLEKAQLYELLFPFSKIILNYCHATKSYSRVAHIHKRLSIAADQIKETGDFYENQSDPWLSPLPGIDKRCFGTFFRLAFYGKLFGELHNKEFVYKEPAFTKLNEISGRLETFYTNMYGEGNVVVLKDSRPVEMDKLKPDKAYIQITFVDVFLSDNERMERSTYFERRNNVNRFYFETPYTMEGRAQGDLSSQYKKRTILTVENSFPYIKTRLRVVNRSIMNFSPIEVAIEDIEKKTRELAAAAQHKNAKMLSMLVQGSIGTTVNQGPLEIANVFLANSMTDERGRPVDRLQNKLRLSFRHLQYRAMEAIELSRQLIGEDQKEYQENVEANFRSFVTHLKPMLSREKHEITISEFSKPTVV
ncbi:hypothetical protein GCK72_024735 [Caenorhabditis remanei]|uniref:Uncharacterized protein n=1 Tax=Caenorhabditis remanei TaxID=31234 RepID=A0A6A5G018_CAERE|nr:hypothetical protein GCK72_024735 [Caenorhabditis remanei]KAF1748268.1 hypothetical protein GCK72_024735 [Caenorhabditis remanei]